MYCSGRCSNKSENRHHEVYGRPGLRGNGEVDYSISIRSISTGYGKICHICGEQCDHNDCYLDSHNNNFYVGEKYPSIDHLIPISRGGTHTKDNVKLAHMRCNSIKGSNLCYGSEGQMRLAF